MNNQNEIIIAFEEILDLEQVLQEALEHNEIAGTHYATMNKLIIRKIQILFDTILRSSQPLHNNNTGL